VRHLAASNMPIQKVTKEEVIQKSLFLFKKKGYHGTSMADLAQECGLQKGSFYHYFASKEVLMKEVLATMRVVFDEKIFPIAFDESLSPRERLVKLLTKQIRIVSSTEGGCLMGNMAMETALVTEEFKPLMRDFFETYLQALTSIYATRFPPERARKLAEQAVIEYEGAWILIKITDNYGHLQGVLERAIERFDQAYTFKVQ
jgi:TetR/AcrR family transcriptional regulator, transcriptional repressor for nem operon